jgi:hypothetical protein
MRLQTRPTPSAMLIALCTLLMSGCGASTSPGDVDPGSRNQADELEDTTAGDAPQAEEDEGFTLCHIPPGNPANAHTITVGSNRAVWAHLNNHGDYLGACKDTHEPDPAPPPTDPTDGGSTPPEDPPVLDAGTPGPVDGGPTCGGRSETCAERPCCSGLTCQSGYCAPIVIN